MSRNATTSACRTRCSTASVPTNDVDVVGDARRSCRSPPRPVGRRQPPAPRAAGSTPGRTFASAARAARLAHGRTGRRRSDGTRSVAGVVLPRPRRRIARSAGASGRTGTPADGRGPARCARRRPASIGSRRCTISCDVSSDRFHGSSSDRSTRSTIGHPARSASAVGRIHRRPDQCSADDGRARRHEQARHVQRGAHARRARRVRATSATAPPAAPRRARRGRRPNANSPGAHAAARPPITTSTAPSRRTRPVVGHQCDSEPGSSRPRRRALAPRRPTDGRPVPGRAAQRRPRSASRSSFGVTRRTPPPSSSSCAAPLSGRSASVDATERSGLGDRADHRRRARRHEERAQPSGTPARATPTPRAR